jgi:superfamily II DNA/RNA helicase
MVATEAVSEGVDLRRSNIVIYYDIPWSASGARTVSI